MQHCDWTTSFYKQIWYLDWKNTAVVDIFRDDVAVMLLNPLDKDVQLYPGMRIVTCEPVESWEKAQCREVHLLVNTLTETDIFSAENTSPNLPPHLEELFQQSMTHLSLRENSLQKLLCEHQEVFVGPDGKLGRTSFVKHTINTGDHKPIRQTPRRAPLHLREEARTQVEKMLEEGIIEPSNSPWSAPIVLVWKKDGSFRYCIDYCLLNKVTVGDTYPIPRVSFDDLQGFRWFSTLDLMSGYWQVEMDLADKQKTAVVCQEGLFHFNLMPFGLTNAPSTLERLMETVLAGLQYNICLVYLDDIIVYGADFDEEISRLKQVFSTLIKAGLKLKPKKCVLFQQKVAYLGYIVSHTEVAPDPSKIEAVENWPTPSTVTEVRSFLGLAAYYRQFVKDFATIASPLHKLTEKGRKFHWKEDCQTSFEALQRCLVTAPILAYPKIEEPFILDTDASNVGIGAVLSQKLEGKEHAIAYGSRCLSNPERRYCVTRRELLAIVYFVKYFLHYLYGRQFLLRTDHGSLRWLFNFKEPEGQVARWIKTLSTFTFEIEHHPGKQHGNADGLSRRPCKQCGQEDVVPLHLVLSEDVTEMPTRTVQTSLETESWIDGWCHETLRANQQEDPDIGKILKMKEESPPKPQWKLVSSENEAVKAYWFLWTQLYIKNGVLYKLWEEETSPTGHWQLVLPIIMREQVMEMLHNHKSAGHLGQHKTLARVRMRFYWYKLKDDVKNWCNQCEVFSPRKRCPFPKEKPSCNNT